MPLEIAGKKLYTLLELREMMGITIPTIRKYIKEGRLKARKIGRVWRVEEANLQAFLSEGDPMKRRNK